MDQHYRASLAILTLFTATTLLGQGGQTCATATPVGAGTYLAQQNAGNGYEANACFANGTENANWYAYTAPFTGHVIVTSCDVPENWIGVETRVSILVGSCGALQCIGSGEDDCWGGPVSFTASYVAFPVVAGVTYYIQWDDFYYMSYFYWKLVECAGSGQGTTYVDADNNGQYDAGEPDKAVLLQVEPGNDFFWAEGDYTRCTAAGSYTITVPDPPPHHVMTTTSQSFTITEPDQVVSGLDFGFWPIPGIHDGEVHGFYNWAWIGQNRSMHCYVRNIGTEPMTPTLTLTLDPLQSYVSSNQPPTSVNGQVITWELPTMMPGEHRTVGLVQHTSLAAVPYEPITTLFQLTLAETDVDVTNNHAQYTVPAKVGCDPNDKQVDRTTLTPDEVADQQPLLYTIRFQNTGNAPAVNVVVVDTLDTDLDLGTLEMIGATHDYVFNLTNGVATWSFPNIMLPDSTTDLAGSQGSFAYRVAPKSSLVLGTELNNRADIYFDFNEAVLTNTTSTVVAIPSAMAERERGGLRVYPTIGTGELTLRWMRDDLADARLTVTDAAGRVVHATSLRNLSDHAPVTLGLEHLSAGSYVLRVEARAGGAQARFVIQR